MRHVDLLAQRLVTADQRRRRETHEAERVRDAARLVQFLLSAKVETMLMDAGYCQLSTRQEGGIAPLTGTSIKGMEVSADALQHAVQTSQSDLAAIFGG